MPLYVGDIDIQRCGGLPVKGYTHYKLSAMLVEYTRNPPALNCLGAATNKGLGNTEGL